MGMLTMKKKAIGERGSWFASVNGERLPCVHQYWIKGRQHVARNIDSSDPKTAELISAIEIARKVIVTTDVVQGEGAGFERAGYVAVFRVSDVRVSDGELHFELVERLTDLK
jgi:hypothetical protein